MLPSKEQKLMNNTSFRQLVLSAMTRAMTTKSDALTVTGSISNEAENKLMAWIREKAKTGSLQNHQNQSLMASNTYVGAILAMFDDTDVDDIVTSEDANGALIIDLDQSKPILITKIESNNYLFMLAGATPEDFTKTELVDGVWQVPAV